MFKVMTEKERSRYCCVHQSRSSLNFGIHILLTLLIFCNYVHGEQSFEVAPKSTYVFLGETATLYCKVKDKTGVLYWEKDGSLLALESAFLTDQHNRAIFGDTGAGEYNLQIVSATPKDAGEYVCKVTPNSSGGANLTSEPATLWLSDLPPQDQNFPKCLMSIQDNLMEDYIVDFTCVIYDLDESAELRWQRMANPINFIPSVQESKNGYTMLKQTTTLTSSDHNSQYQCIYTSGGFTGSRSCSTGNLAVKHRPIVSLSPRFFSALVGEKAKFTCHLESSYPESDEPPFSWRYKNENILSSENRYETYLVGTEDEELVINDLNGGDHELEVECIASNSVGLSQATAVISVNLSSGNISLTKGQFLRWLIPIAVLVTALILALLLVIALFDVCSCCRKERKETYTWGSADNLTNASARRGSDVSSLPTDYYMTRQIRTSSRNDSRSPTPNRPPSQLNYSGGSQPIPVSPIPPSSTSPPPHHEQYHVTTISRSPQPEGPQDGHLYKQRKTRGERDRNHVRQHQLRRKNTPHRHEHNKNIVYADLDFNDNSVHRNGRHSANGLSDSGLDFANSSVDSRSVTPQERIVYARIVRSDSSSPNTRYPGDADLRPPPGSAGNREVTREELADMLIHS